MPKVKFYVNRRIRGWKFHILHGSFAWEVQIGRHVFFCKYGTHKLIHWTDPYGKKG